MKIRNSVCYLFSENTLVLLYHTEQCSSDLVRRYIDRQTKERFKRLSKYDDDPKYITEKGPHIPDFDDAVKAKRIIYLKDVEASPQQITDIVNERINELCQAAEETSQYIQQVNNHLDKQKVRVDELKKLQKIFEGQMKSLTGNIEK